MTCSSDQEEPRRFGIRMSIPGRKAVSDFAEAHRKELEEQRKAQEAAKSGSQTK